VSAWYIHAGGNATDLSLLRKGERDYCMKKSVLFLYSVLMNSMGFPTEVRVSECIASFTLIVRPLPSQLRASILPTGPTSPNSKTRNSPVPSRPVPSSTN